jgi:rare lipoprotein A (peptidoglycan hydrolase)
VLLHTDLVRFRTPVSTTTTSTTVPVTTTTAAPLPTTTTTTEAPPPPVTTTTEAPAAAPVASAGGGNSESGGATYYASQFPANGCASPDLPKGTVLTVTTASGASVVCTVDDKEGDNPGRVVDLSPTQFSELAPLSEGVIEVTVSW